MGRETFMMMNQVIRHYDLLIDENNDPVRDSEPLRDYMNQWDGQGFVSRICSGRPEAALEIGVGTGRLAVRVAPLCGQFYGIDISPKTVKRAEENLAFLDNVTLFCGDFMEYCFQSKFDVIYSSLTFMHIEEKQKAVDKAASLLRDGGRLVLSIDKNQDEVIDMGTRRIPVFPDNLKDMKAYISAAGLTLMEQDETELAYILVAQISKSHLSLNQQGFYDKINI